MPSRPDDPDRSCAPGAGRSRPRRRPTAGAPRLGQPPRRRASSRPGRAADLGRGVRSRRARRRDHRAARPSARGGGHTGGTAGGRADPAGPVAGRPSRRHPQRGAVLAHGAYPDPQLRPFTDLDILVPGHRLGDAIGELVAHGYARTRPEPAPGFDARVGKAITLSHPGGVVIDLHRTLVAGILGESIDVDGLVSTRRHVSIGRVPIPGPSWEAHLVESALHAVVGDGLARALSIRDVAQVALHPPPRPRTGRRPGPPLGRGRPGGRWLRRHRGIRPELPTALRGLADRHPALPMRCPRRSARPAAASTNCATATSGGGSPSPRPWSLLRPPSCAGPTAPVHSRSCTRGAGATSTSGRWTRVRG